VNILVWPVDGSWLTAFIHGRHRYLVPVDDTPYRARTSRWPYSAVAVRPDEVATADVDVVVLQRPEEHALARAWLGERNVPTVYVEHNAPTAVTRHPMADRDDLRLVHVARFNELVWDTGATRTTVIEPGIVPPAARYSGDLERVAVVSTVGTDLVDRFTPVAPLDVFGPGTDALTDRLARRRLYLHPTRRPSPGPSLIEAMMMGMPVVALAGTDTGRPVPEDTGIVSTRLDDLVDAAQWLIKDPDAAHRIGWAGRAAAMERYDLDRFLFDWDRLLEEACASR
jgi:hypothetical protein